MNDEQTYSSRFYVKKRKRFNPWPYLIILVILGGSWVLFNSLKKDHSLPYPAVSNDENTGRTRQRTYNRSRSTNDESSGVINENEDLDNSRHEPGLPALFGNPSTEGRTGSPGDSTQMAANLHQAMGFYQNGEFKKALPLFKRYADNTNDFNALLYTGLCCFKLEDPYNAVTYLEKAVQVDENNFLARKYLAFAHYKTDALDESLANAEAGLSLSSDSELQYLRNKILREKTTMKGYGDKQRVNFRIQFSKEEHNDIRDTVHFILKDAYREIGQQMNFYPSQPVTVILYNEKGFFDVTRAPGWAGGLYDGKIRIPIQGVEGQEETLKRVLHHEYVHALVHAITPRCPHWLNEGLAVYFTEDEEELRGYGEKLGQAIPLQLLESSFPSGNVRAVLAAYLESYTAVVYLIEKYGLFRVKELLEALGKGENLESAFNSVFYTSYSQFVKKWGKD
jgi:tetratricopeptide (TPR) repeat protein